LGLLNRSTASSFPVQRVSCLSGIRFSYLPWCTPIEGLYLSLPISYRFRYSCSSFCTLRVALFFLRWIPRLPLRRILLKNPQIPPLSFDWDWSHFFSSFRLLFPIPPSFFKIDIPIRDRILIPFSFLEKVDGVLLPSFSFQVTIFRGQSFFFPFTPLRFLLKESFSSAVAILLLSFLILEHVLRLTSSPSFQPLPSTRSFPSAPFSFLDPVFLTPTKVTQ